MIAADAEVKKESRAQNKSPLQQRHPEPDIKELMSSFLHLLPWFAS